MSKLAKLVQHLRKDRDQAQSRLDQLDKALNALTGVSGVGGSNGRSSLAHTPGKRKTMPAYARKQIASAQRARWAKWKAAHERSKRNRTAFSTFPFTDTPFPLEILH
jgi:hypothetical protein